MYGLLLLVTVVISCLMLAPGIRDWLTQVRPVNSKVAPNEVVMVVKQGGGGVGGGGVWRVLNIWNQDHHLTE